MDLPSTLPHIQAPSVGLLLGFVVVAFPFLLALLPSFLSNIDEGTPNEMLWERNGGTRLNGHGKADSSKSPVQPFISSTTNRSAVQIRPHSEV